MIRTTEIKLTEKSYFKMLLVKHFEERWGWFAWLSALSVFQLYRGDLTTLSYFFIFSPLLLAIYVFFYFRHFAYAKDNRIYLLSRYYEIDSELMIGFLEDGTQSQIKLDHFIKIYKTKDFILLYLSQISMIYLPKYAFRSSDEYDEAVRVIEESIKKTNEKIKN